jgi:hypothetical protein
MTVTGAISFAVMLVGPEGSGDAARSRASAALGWSNGDGSSRISPDPLFFLMNLG